MDNEHRGPLPSSTGVRLLAMPTVTVNPEVLVWARETAGRTQVEAAAKLGFKDTRTMTAAERLAALERGEKAPTRSKLAAMARIYHRPLLTFYLPAPPRQGERGTDFRRPAGASSPLEPDVDALVRDVLSRQDMVRATLIAEDEARPLEFIGALQKRTDPATAHRLLQELLPEELRSRYYKEQDAKLAFALLRSHVEQRGVFVVLKGNLGGSHHTRIGPQAFRGFAIADSVAPFVVINEYDFPPAAWSFTLLHELIHLLLGQTGLSGSEAKHRREERFCNQVAGEWLLPDGRLESLILNHPAGINEQVTSFASDHNLSNMMVAYRLLQADRIDRETYGTLCSFLALWQKRERDQKKTTQSGGPDYYTVRAHRIGPALLQFCQRMMDSDALSTARVARILGIKPYQVGKLFQHQDLLRR